jgi:protein-disulfide isomerase
VPKTPGNPAAPDPRAARAARAAQIRVERERKAKRAKTRNLSILIGLVLVLGAVAFVIAQRGPGQANTAVARPPAVAAVGSGFSYGTGPVNITIYEDFQCPVCKRLEELQGASLAKLVQQNKATVVYAPISILDNASAGYSTRAANAAYCAPQDKFKAFHDSLYTNQPAEGGSGLPEAKVMELATKAGITGDTFASCVKNNTYSQFVKSQYDFVNKRFTDAGDPRWGTPGVFVNGKTVSQWDQPGFFDQIVAQESAGSTASSTPVQ